MDYKGFYKNASRGLRLKDANSQLVRTKRESSRQDLHFTNRNLSASDVENDENEAGGCYYRKEVQEKSEFGSGKKRRRQQRDEEDKENREFRKKYEERLERLLKFKEQRAKAKQNSVKKRPFISVVSKRATIDREYEKNLFKKGEEQKHQVEKRKPLTPAAKNATPRVDTRRPVQHTGEKERAKRILNLRTPASVKKAKPKVDTWRKGMVVVQESTAEKKTVLVAPPRTRNAAKTSAMKGVNKQQQTATTAVTYKKGDGLMAGSNSAAAMRYLEIRSGQKSVQFMFQFSKDGSKMVTSTNRKKRKSKEKLQRANPPDQLQLYRFSPKTSSPPIDEDDVFEGISPIDVDTPTPKKVVKDSDAIAMIKRESRRRSMIFKVEDIKQEQQQQQEEDEWEPQVITISDEDSGSDVSFHKVDDDNKQPPMNESFTVVQVKEEKLPDRRPTIDEESPRKQEGDCGCDSPRLIGSGRKSYSGRPSLVFVEENNVPTAGPPTANPDISQATNRRNSLVFLEEKNVPDKIHTIEVFDSPKRAGTMSPRGRLSGTPKLTFAEEDIPMSKPLPEGNLATVLLNKQQESKRRSSGGSRRSSLVSFREEDQPPADVREKVVFYYNQVDKELKRLGELCDLYKADLESEEVDENGKGLIMAAQGQTTILINKKLSKFKELVGHYERSWADQKVRTDDLDGFWFMVSLDLENLDRRFEELRILKENNWQEVVEQQPKVKKIIGGGGIKKRDKKPMKTKASGLADLIKKAREEAKKKIMMESALTETVQVVTPVKRSVRIATTPRRSSLSRNSICTGCTPTPGKSCSKKSRKTIFNDHTLRKKEIVKSILKTPSEKRRAKSVLFLDSGMDTPEAHRTSGGGCGRKIVHTPKPKITFNDDLEVEDVETISIKTPYKLDEEIRKRRRSSLFVNECRPEEEDDAEEEQQPERPTEECTRKSSNRRRTLRFSMNAEEEQEEARDQIGSPIKIENAKKDKSSRTGRGKSKGRVSFL